MEFQAESGSRLKPTGIAVLAWLSSRLAADLSYQPAFEMQGVRFAWVWRLIM
jgi:hypothetical protein